MTVPLCTSNDVLARPTLSGVTLTSDQVASIDGAYIDEASALVCGYLGDVYEGTADDPVPSVARIVAARMVARALTATPVDANVDQYNSTMGPFASGQRVTPDALGGGVWWTRTDKAILDGIASNACMTNLTLFNSRSCPPAPPSWWLLAPASGG